MNTARYVIAVLVLIGLPPGVCLWFLIHPFASFWRTKGPVWTYTIVGLPMVGLMVCLFWARKTLLGVDFGTSYPLVLVSMLPFAMAATIAVKRRKLLTFGVLAGLPELSEARYPGKLLTVGPYAKIRHPRYVEILLATFSYALFANFMGPYILAAVAVPVIFFIVLIEEKELRERFGEAYERYCDNVPRFFPKLTKR